MSAETLSLLFYYIPGLSTWYEGLGDWQDGGTQKRLVMLGVLVLVSLVSSGT